VQDPQRFAEETLRYHHDESLYVWGEYAVFVLLWTTRDENEGLVGRCPTCYLSYGKIADAYGQASKERCPDCFGTTFEGGYRALIVRPTLWTDTDDADKPEERRGTVVVSQATVQSTSDFVMRTGDYVFRADGTRWRVGGVDAESVTTGFDTKASPYDNVGVAAQSVMRLDESHVAYTIAMTIEEQIELLDLENVRRPIDFTATEDLRGPLW
jgi:hypothetical protein